jgi:hypothetical protein
MRIGVNQLRPGAGRDRAGGELAAEDDVVAVERAGLDRVAVALDDGFDDERPAGAGSGGSSHGGSRGPGDRGGPRRAGITAATRPTPVASTAVRANSERSRLRSSPLSEILTKLRLQPGRSWPAGVYFFGEDVLRVGIVVASELPRDRATLLVRLMAAGPLLAQAIEELSALPPSAHERAVAEQILVNLQHALGQQPRRTPEEQEFIVTMYKTWEEGAPRRAPRRERVTCSPCSAFVASPYRRPRASASWPRKICSGWSAGSKRPPSPHPSER